MMPAPAGPPGFPGSGKLGGAAFGGRVAGALLFALALVPAGGAAPARPRYPWHAGAATPSIASEIPPPAGFRREPVPAASFAGWLRDLPLLPGRPPVRLYDGRLKANQAAHHAVLDIDPGDRDLQQCADAVIRLRAEYLYSAGRDAEIVFRFTSGSPAEWARWRDGWRPVVRGNRVSWSRSARADRSHRNFREYLNTVFAYAGSASLAAELEEVPDPSRVEAGDVFIQGGFPGHAVIVADVAVDSTGRRVFLLAQSFMPAQQIHMLRNPADPVSPWYRAERRGALVTPEWVFEHRDLRRFPEVSGAGGL